MEEKITIRYDETELSDCVSAVIVPEKALVEPGYIKTMTGNAEAHSKHEFHTMAQVAYYRYQDDELEIVEVDGIVTVECGSQVETISSGMLIYRDDEGEFHVLIHPLLSKKKMLECTNRYCTRWVRLDI